MAASAPSAQDLPVYRLGIDLEPSACWHCTGTLLRSDVPYGGPIVGLLLCSRCRRPSAWLEGATVQGSPLRRVVTGSLRIDFERFLVTVDGRPVPLSAVETRLLLHLARRLDHTCSQQELLTAVWGPVEPDLATAGGLLRSTMHRLRVRLGPGARDLIQTYKGLGFRLLAVAAEHPANGVHP